MPLQAVDPTVPSLSASVAQMGSIRQDDPFLWDAETLSGEICFQNTPWIKDPAALAAKLIDNDIDGRTLLTYEFLLSKAELMECLNLKAARSKADLAETIINFRARSKSFRSWKKTFLKTQSALLSDDEQDDVKTELSPIPPVKRPLDPTPTPNARSISTQYEPHGTVEAPSVNAQIIKVFDGALLEPDGDLSMQLDGDADSITRVDSANGLSSIASQAPSHTSADDRASEEKSCKRRRLEPMNLSAKPLADPNSLSLFQSESFNLIEAAKIPSNSGQRSILEPISEHSYLGSERIYRQDILSSNGTPDYPWNDLGGGGFAIVTPSHAKPPGRRLVVNRMLRMRFLKNSQKQASMKRGFIPLQSPTPSDGSEAVIDLDALPDSWDELTQREIDDEKAEIAAKQHQPDTNISRERAEVILKEELAAMEANWKEKKLPKRERRAYKDWMGVKRTGQAKKEILESRKRAEHLDGRIKKFYTGILSSRWDKESDLRDQAATMETSLIDKLDTLWFISLLERRHPPPKPLGLPMPKSSAPKVRLENSDDELLTSSDEEGFIVPDNDRDVAMTDGDFFKSTPASPRERRIRETSHPLSEVDASMVIDLTQVESLPDRQDREATIECIDLTISPVKKQVDDAPLLIKEEPIYLTEEVPPMAQLGSLEKIGETSAKHWAKAKDRWRLVLCLLWKLMQARREPILQAMQKFTAEEAWQAFVASYIANPFTKESDIGKDQANTTAFDLTKLFLSFCQCRHYADDRILALKEKDQNRLNRAKAFFSAFHAFIREWAPKYPQSSQIFRTDAFDDALDDEIGPDELSDHSANVTQSSSKPRKRATREIVQNKEGVELREQGKKRAEEYEARAAKNLKLATLSSTMTEGEARLIINESKQDGQPFIYISRKIGERIKDHQIKGVRFLWNQIILNADLRQGCLLAHTMGLGKTMQVITLLVAIAEASHSDNEAIKAQIPMDLRTSQSLIICPAGLVINWLEEINAWSPEGILGNVFKVESAQSKSNQISTIEYWAEYGGVLVMGHEMFKRTRAENDNMKQILTDKANIVICDEAHTMKNPDSQLHQVCQDFLTRRRIALTGSPLSNNIKEYYSMINWVAPRYLGPQKEFADIYAEPIERGLDRESSWSEKRKALKMLEVLKMTVAPKVQRATVQVVKHELPPKYEFVLFVKPNPLQEKLYGIYLNEMVAASSKTSVVKFVAQLGVICNHPRCFRQLMLNEKAASKTPKAAQQSVRGPGDEGTDDESESHGRSTKFPPNMISTVLKETNGKDIANPELSQKVALLLVVLDQARAMGDKVLVFSESILTLDYLEELFKQQRRAVQRLDGSTPVSKRQGMVKAFNTGKAGESEIYLISTKAGGVGLNIQGANRVVIFDFKWNPVNEQQAVGRSYRFGQQKTVYVYRFVIAGSFEEGLQNRSIFKTQLASRVVDKANPIAWGKRNGDLFKPMATKPASDLSPFLGQDTILDKLIELSKDNGAIRKILSTDTYEEEDPANELTAEEKKDAQELHDMERLKQTDPEKYRKMYEEKQRAAQIRAMADAARPPQGIQMHSSPYPAHPQYNQQAQQAQQPQYNQQPQHNQQAFVIPGLSFQPVPNANTPSFSQAQPAPMAPAASRVHFPSSAPLPIPGANTYIMNSAAYTNPSGNKNVIMPFRPSPTPQQGAESLPSPPGPSSAPMLALTSGNPDTTNVPNTTTSLFSQSRNHSKTDFENVLATLVNEQRVQTVNAAELAERVTVGISEALKKQAWGFLPDNHRWRLLVSLIREHDRLVPAIIWGNYTPEYLATAPEKELQDRILLMNSQTQGDFNTQLQRSASAPDPSNLHDNINRPISQSPRASEDAEAMRQTAHNRTERSFRLPPWANDALSKSNTQTP
ncbi:hypothetical protein TRIATDRAFT_321436 [Trichoderma atroviride IMI 206040]|uniref:Uncharacterized protein n=1 Tax=Hypocrea atroviridis (strain ATCC 20476 / IMI 206040) TaxID=452589 RepID=G9P4P4_HYPAI|nr:uncharacterized protein TRIATDRAFT_321436 [Trichoderma atroviride IMI 206040]EHK41190.1 hypothetical protein TRIATDRAFT_321436 [Trichoderma atroviride IMI 206040]